MPGSEPCLVSPPGWQRLSGRRHSPGTFGKAAAGPCLGVPLCRGHEEGEPLPPRAHTDPAPPAAGTAGEEALQPARNSPQEQPCASPKAGPLSPGTIKSSHPPWVIPLSFVSHPPLPFSRRWDQRILFFLGAEGAFPVLAGLGGPCGGHGTASARWALLGPSWPGEGAWFTPVFAGSSWGCRTVAGFKMCPWAWGCLWVWRFPTGFGDVPGRGSCCQLGGKLQGFGDYLCVRCMLLGLGVAARCGVHLAVGFVPGSG